MTFKVRTLEEGIGVPTTPHLVTRLIDGSQVAVTKISQEDTQEKI